MTQESKLPFDLSINLPTGGNEAFVELSLNCESEQREDLEPSDEVVQIFNMAVKAQMFSDGEPRNVTQSEIVENVFDASNRIWKYVFKMRAVPPTAFTVLIALLAQTCRFGDPIKRVTIRPRGEIQGHFNLEQLINELTNRPVPNPNLPFGIEWAGRVLESRGIMFTFEFSTPINRELMERFEKTLNVWDHLLFLGGFKFDFKENEAFWPRIGRTGHLTPTLVTHVLDVFNAPPFVLNCVFNCAAAIHNQGYQIRMVTVE